MRDLQLRTRNFDRGRAYGCFGVLRGLDKAKHAAVDVGQVEIIETVDMEVRTPDTIEIPASSQT